MEIGKGEILAGDEEGLEVIIGDDFLTSLNLYIRNSDGHTIYEINGLKPINEPKFGIHIGNHVWCGYDVAILKDADIPSNCVIGTGAVVGKGAWQKNIKNIFSPKCCFRRSGGKRMYKQVNLFQKPHEILDNMEEGYCEMKEDEHAFLCGLIQEKNPEKVLEVGVAGGVLPKYIEEIGSGIDFCVLDTTHAVPGEILDFLCAFPYLSDGAIVVLHDVANNLLGKSPIAYATKILLDTVTATKYYEFRYGISNIGAFAINRETKENIANVFSSLSITWAYEPKLSEMLVYRDCYKRFYDEECMELFDMFWEKNRSKLTEK